MLQRLGLVVSHRIRSLIEKMRDKRYRDGYVAAHTRQVLAKQMREFRGSMPQMEFAAAIGKRQTMVSRLENPNYVGWTLSTMFEIARKLDVAVFVRFVDFATFLRLSEDMSDNALRPRGYNQVDLDALLEEPEENRQAQQFEQTALSETAFNWTNQLMTAANPATFTGQWAASSLPSAVNQAWHDTGVSASFFSARVTGSSSEVVELQRERGRDKKKIAELQEENRRLTERLARRESLAFFGQERQSRIEFMRNVQILPAFIAATPQPQGRVL